MRALWLAILCLVGIAISAAAADPDTLVDTAYHAFDEGRFLEAAALARRSATPEGYAFAARAELVHADFIAPREARLASILRAEEDARTAISLAPDLAEGHLQLAIALGLRGRVEGRMTAHFEGYADEARAHLDYVVAREPDNPWVHALLGGWHLEISEEGGSLGRTLYGAGIERGVAEYERALSLSENDLVIGYQCALQLAALDDETYKARAETLLEDIAVPEPPTALQRLTLERIDDLRAALESGDRERIRQVVLRQKGEAMDLPSKPVRPRHSIRPPIGLPR